MLQLEVPDEVRGRVMSFSTVAFQGFSPFGGLIAGAMATSIGTPDAVMLSALVVGGVAVMGAIALGGVRDFVPAIELEETPEGAMVRAAT
jgi:hypothetical protein